MRYLRIFLLPTATLFVTGCANLGYYSQAVTGQLDILARTRTIAELLDDGPIVGAEPYAATRPLAPAVKARLATVLRCATSLRRRSPCRTMIAIVCMPTWIAPRWPGMSWPHRSSHSPRRNGAFRSPVACRIGDISHTSVPSSLPMSCAMSGWMYVLRASPPTRHSAGSAIRCSARNCAAATPTSRRSSSTSLRIRSCTCG